MVISYEEASAELTGPGRTFELGEDDINGVDYRVFKHAPRTLVDVFAGSREDESTFLVYEDERWSFKETHRHIDALAHALVHTFGVQKGDRVGIAMRNLPEWIVSFAAILSIGAVSVSFNAWWTESELDYALEDSGSVLLVVDGERVERAHRPAAQRRVPVIAARVTAGQALPDGVQRYEDVVTLGDPMPAVVVLPEDDATILYTSGTTGFPKGAVSTHRAVTQSLMAFWARAAIDAARQGGDRVTSDGASATTLIHLDRAALPRHRLRARHALVLRPEDEAGDDVPLGSGGRPAPDRGRTGHRVRRRPDPKLGPAREPGLLRVRHLVARLHRRRGSTGTGQARRAGRRFLFRWSAQHRLRHDRDQRVRPGQHR